jgi:predicted acylesterase/phospholipase RssA
MPFKMQLAIQGGGAKLTLLLAAASPVQQLIRNKQIQLTRVVGTSAGAIVASFLAADIDIEAFRRVLQAGKGKELLAKFKKPGKIRALNMLATGDPLWSEKPLIDLLTAEFKREKLVTIADVVKVQKTELQIVSTNLATADSTVAAPTDTIVHALTNSCGLPFIFRSWKTGPLVDGGITQNFAWQNLAEAPGAGGTYGPVIGIMFDREPPNKTPDSRLGFCASLLEAAMDSATERARLSLGKAQIFSIPAKFGTFDFDKALDRGLDQDYEMVAASSKEWFTDFIADPDAVRGNIWSGESIATMTKTASMYKQQHSQRFLEYKRCSMVFHARGLEKEGVYDVVEYEMEFNTLNNEVFCHKLALSQSDAQNTGFLKSSWVIIDQTPATGANPPEDINISYVPVLDQTTTANREVLAYFDPVLKPGRTYLLKVTDLVRGLSDPLKGQRMDPMLMVLERSNLPIGEIHIVVNLPDNDFCKNAHWVEKPGQHRGEEMSKVEVKRYQSPGYRPPLGWKGAKVSPNYYFGAVLHL